MTDASRLNPLSNPIANIFDEVRENILGRSSSAKLGLFETQLARDPTVVDIATRVEPDAFVLLLQRNHMRSKSEMTNDHEIPPGTELETNEEIERVREELKRSSPNHKKSYADRPAQPYRPTVRPPAANLIVCDDGENIGEVIRLRTDPFIIGRTEGDFQVPDDEQISSRHVALTRQTLSGQTRWVVTDLQSRNGLFVRVGKSPIAHQSEFLTGGGRYRLEIMQQTISETAAFADLNQRNTPKTRAFENNLTVGGAMLTELLAGGVGTRIALDREQFWIGSDQECEVCRPNDPFVSHKHASLTRSPKGTWVLQNHDSLNGVWVRMPQIVLEPGKKCEFQIGEQRFRLRYGVSL